MNAVYDKNCENCVWWETFACEGLLVEDGKPIEPCARAITMKNNMPEFNKIRQEYDSECDKAMEPVFRKFKKKFEGYALKDYDFKDKK